jgi:hypothetical protein
MQSCHFIGLAFTVVAAGETQQKALLQKWLIAAGSLLFPMQVDLSWIFLMCVIRPSRPGKVRMARRGIGTLPVGA